MVRLALCSAMSEDSPEARLLTNHGFVLKVVSNAADITLPVTGGSLAFVLHKGSGVPPPPLVERARTAARSSRRCTIVWVIPEPKPDAFEQLQLSLSAGVSVAACESHEVAVEHMIACATRAAHRATAEASWDATLEVSSRASQHLAALWGAGEPLDVDYLLTQRSLSSLARITSEEAFKQLLRENERDVIKPELIYAAVDWLQNDNVAMW